MADKDPLDHDGDGRKGGAVKLAPVKLLRDFWPEEDVRVPAGEVIEITAATARRLIEEGVAERADPLPGE